MCSRTVSDPANRLLKRTDSEGSSSVAEKKSSAVPLFHSGHMLAICAGLSSKGKVGVQRGRKTAGCPSFLPTAVGTASSPPRGAARSRRPQTANPPAEVQRKTPRPSGANTLTQFVCPGQPVLKKVPPGQGEHANAVRAPRSAGAEKAAAPFERTACAVRVSRLTLRSYLTILRRQSMLSQQQNRRKYEPVHPCTLRSVPRH